MKPDYLDPAVDNKSPDEMEPIILERLREQVIHALSNSVYYKELFKNAGVCEKDINSLSDLQKLPFSNRDDLEKNNRDFMCRPMDEISDISRTSGTTGDPIYMAMSYEDLSHAAGMTSRLLNGLNIGKGDRVAILTPLNDLVNPSIVFERSFRDFMGLPTFRIGSISKNKQLTYLRDFGVTTVNAAPSLLLALAQSMDKHRFEPADFKLKSALLIGQPLYGPGWEPLELKKRIEEIWGIKVYSGYGSTEMSSYCVECEKGAGQHIQWESLIIEIVDPDTGVVLPPGKTGEVVITTLYREAMPLIRYRSGDISSLETGECECGRKSPRLMAVLGRKDEFFKINGIGLFPIQMENCVMKVPEVDAYQIQVYTDMSGQDQIDVFFSTSSEPEAVTRKVSAQFTDDLELSPVALARDRTEIEWRLYKHGSNKPNRFEDLRVKN
ncbi:MAG: AMP-binding protein [Chloroflexi bacterium]|nr:AMP-binding protein [Chloroflexota bacterium]